MKQVLVVEDSASCRKILILLLKRLGFEVISCEDGLEAQAFLKAAPTQLAAIFSDYMMPRMNGIELLRFVRNYAATAEMPFVIVSALDETAIQKLEYANHADRIVKKPVAFANLKDICLQMGLI